MLNAASLRGPPTSTRSPYPAPPSDREATAPPAVTIRGLCRGYRRYPTCDRCCNGEEMSRGLDLGRETAGKNPVLLPPVFLGAVS